MNRSQLGLCAVALIFTTAFAGNKSPEKITFVCEHGVAKSVIAAQYFNQRAAERGLPFVAEYRGINPEAELQAATKAGLNKDGLPVVKFVSATVTAGDVQQSLKVVTIGVEQEPDFLKNDKLLEWDGVPAVSKSYDAARDDMVARIDALLSDLQHARK